MAHDKGCDIPEPIYIKNIMGSVRGSRPKHVLIDEVYLILGDTLSNYIGSNVICATMTDRKREIKAYNEKRISIGE